MDNLLDEFSTLLNFSKIYKNINLKKYKNIIPSYIIKSDYILHKKNNIIKVHIHFNYKCSGSKNFKYLLKKFNLNMEWFDNYTLLLF